MSKATFEKHEFNVTKASATTPRTTRGPGPATSDHRTTRTQTP